MNPKAAKVKDIEDLLESDDELPDDYVDVPYIPAYQNDDRFKTVPFNWKDIINKNDACHSPPIKNQVRDIGPSQFLAKALKKGVLNKNDVFVSKCIEVSDDTMLLWFVNFLLLKDLQSGYQFLTSCLVPSIEYGCYSVRTFSRNREEQRYKIVIKE